MMKQLCISIPFILVILTCASSMKAQSCQTRDEIGSGVRSGIETRAQQVFDQAVQGDVDALKSSAIPSLQGSFAGIAAAVTDNKAALASAHAQVRATFLIETGEKPVTDGRYLCGVFGANGLSGNSAEFALPDLTTGKYAIVVQDLTGGSHGPYAFTSIFQDVSGWKLAGFYLRPETAAGRDGMWYLQRAREYKAKGEKYNAWFHYVTSWELLAPVSFMESNLLAKITQESSQMQPTDVPSNGSKVSFSANGKSYDLTEVTVFSTDVSFELSIKYAVSSASDAAATQAEARSLAAAYAAKHPELKEAFTSVLAHAVDPSGVDVVGMVSLKSN